jgi:hypothetical protein
MAKTARSRSSKASITGRSVSMPCGTSEKLPRKVLSSPSPSLESSQRRSLAVGVEHAQVMDTQPPVGVFPPQCHGVV